MTLRAKPESCTPDLPCVNRCLTNFNASCCQALAYLPTGVLSRWKKPNILIILLHRKGDLTTMLSLTLRSLVSAHFMGDEVDLRIVLHPDATRDPEVRDSRNCAIYIRNCLSSSFYIRPSFLAVYRNSLDKSSLFSAPFKYAVLIRCDEKDRIQRTKCVIIPSPPSS